MLTSTLTIRLPFWDKHTTQYEKPLSIVFLSFLSCIQAHDVRAKQFNTTCTSEVMLHKYLTGMKYYTKALTKAKNQMKYFQFAFLRRFRNRIYTQNLMTYYCWY